MSDPVAGHIRACEGFSTVVGRVDGRWDRPSPCGEWDARGVLEHVIGFHDVLLLRPLHAKPERPRADPVARWETTANAIASVLLSDDEVRVRAALDAAGIDLPHLLPMLTTDVLVHTWDLARAVGVDVELDPGLCDGAYRGAQRNAERLRGSPMFAPAVPVAEDATVQTRLIALLGRDPSWTAL